MNRGPAPGAAPARTGPLLRWLRSAQWRAQAGRSLACLAAVAIGVALALAIYLVNATALSSFQQAIDAINGEADLRVVARSERFDEELLDRVAALDGVQLASPVLDLTLQVRSHADGPTRALRLIAVDPLTAIRLTPGLVPPGPPSTRPDAIWLSTAAWRQLGLPEQPAEDRTAAGQDDDGGADTGGKADTSAAAREGAKARATAATGAAGGADAAAGAGVPPEDDLPRLEALTGAGLRSLAVAGIARGIEGEAVALMDLGSAQWAFGQVGQLSRIDLRLATDRPVAARRAALAAALGPAVEVVAPADDSQRMSNISRAYRVNLNVLALVALLTGAFIVFASMSLAALRQQPVFALFTVLGARPGFAPRALLGQASWIGLAGAILGVVLGIGLAQTLLVLVGGDLGGGYFAGSRPRLAIDWVACVGFGALGWLTALAGALAPALSTRHLPAMAILRQGAIQALESPTAARRRLVIALALALIGLALAFAPPIGGLPLPAYAAIALLLLAGILATPTMIALVTALIERTLGRTIWRHPAAWLALAYQRRAAAAMAIALAGVVASFALAVAMVVMVASFRGSVDEWLETVLPAEWYVRLASGSVPVDEALQDAVIEAARPSRVEFLRARTLALDPLAPPVTLLARDAADSDALAARLPLTGPVVAAAAGKAAAGTAATAGPGIVGLDSGTEARPGDPSLDAFVSEPMVSRHGYQPGETRTIAIDGQTVSLRIRGVWRDYARQGGAIVVVRDAYRRVLGDASVTDLALWPAPGVDGPALVERLRGLDPLLAAGDWRSAAELRRISLVIFDRSFAITHVLEAVAILVGLFGVATTYASQALTRSREFGMLRHLGVDRRTVVAQLATEASIGTLVAVAWGALIGFAIALVLIERVNPQSFHWTMDVRVPWLLLGLVGLALIVTAVVTAMIATRSASSGEPVAALRRDA